MKRIILANFICLLMSCSNAALSESTHYDDAYSEGLRLYLMQQYIDAESSFIQSTGYNARIGRAFSNIQLENLNIAIALFKQSVLLAKNDDERFLSLYNAAVCSFLLADYESAFTLFVDSDKYIEENQRLLDYIKLSKYLAALVRAQQVRNNIPSKNNKSSEGKRTVSAVEFVFDDDINLRIEDGESTESLTLNQQQLYISDKALIKSLVAAGIASIKINKNGQDAKVTSPIDIQIASEFSNLEEIPVTSSASTPDLWKRIFEIEQGYPASLEKAESLPGVRPW